MVTVQGISLVQSSIINWKGGDDNIYILFSEENIAVLTKTNLHLTLLVLTITNLQELFWFLLNLRQGRRNYIDVLSKYLEIHGTIAGKGSEVGLLTTVRYGVMGLGVSCIHWLGGFSYAVCARWLCVCVFFIAFFNSNDLTDFYDFCHP